ncbi:MAG TPA: IS630 family transposase, partial [Gemmatimonadaceae bacterium]|nr:IS630 family transposase [Gemmatimonadaceae bacterium]
LLRTDTLKWEEDRNREGIRTNWRFTVTDARVKLHRLYTS